MTRDLEATPEELWSGLDEAWQESFRQAWEAFRTGNIPVGACASTPDGKIVRAARNRVTDSEGPAGEVFGSTVAHAEVNVLAGLPWGRQDPVVLSTTLEPCIQCSAVIRLGPVATVRYAGGDPVWEGCHDFSPLSAREAARAKRVTINGPRSDEVGLFGTLMSRLGPGFLRGPTADWVRAAGQARILDLASQLRESGEERRLSAIDVDEAFRFLWPRLRALRSPG
jgi:tRNA(Arg) A34 adenosine deaminase TadA